MKRNRLRCRTQAAHSQFRHFNISISVPIKGPYYRCHAKGVSHARQSDHHHQSSTRGNISILARPAESAALMSHIEAVDVIDERRSHWRAKAPAGSTVEWDSEIVEDQPGRSIAWRALEGSDVRNDGRVSFV